jgi:4-amino-4-deoxychorismate lyase
MQSGSGMTVTNIDLGMQMRVLLHKNGSLQATATAITSIPFAALLSAATMDLEVSASGSTDTGMVIVVDTIPTMSSPFTRSKTDNRAHYDEARKRAALPALGVSVPASTPAEVLLFNEREEVTETSIRNIAFRRNGRWLTPQGESGCLLGVVRQRLLDVGLISESSSGQATHVQQLEDGETVMTFNAVEGCRLGRLRLHNDLA